MARAWEVSRVIDIFQLNPQWGVNYNAVITTGTSFMGKRALFPGIMDERVAITMPHESGGDGGVAPFRFSHAGRIQFYGHDTFDSHQTNRVHSRHETPRTGNSNRAAGGATGAFVRADVPYEYSIHRLPFDMHLAIALTAPTLNNPNRAFISLETTNFGTWTGWSPARTVVAAAQEVFHFLGNDNLIFLMKNSGHFPHPTDAPVWLAAVDYLFGQPVHDTPTGFRGGRASHQVYVEDINYAAYPGIWPSLGYLSRTPIEVESAWMPWARPGHVNIDGRYVAHPGYNTIWTETIHITQGLPGHVVAYTCSPDGSIIELLLWSHGNQNRLWGVENPPELLERWTAIVRNGQAAFYIPAEPIRPGQYGTRVGRYELRVYAEVGRSGNIRRSGRSAFFQGIDIHTALRTGATTDNIGGGGSRLFGFTSRIVNSENLQLFTVTHDGIEEQITATTWQSSSGNWITPFGVRLRGAEPPGTYVLRGLQLEAMPGFTFEISFANDLHNVEQPPSIWRPSPEVQHIGPYPHFRVSGNADVSWSRPNADPITPLPQRPTTFTYLPTTYVLDRENEVLTINFPGAIDPRDFGIGFNFSDNFSLQWSECTTLLTINFNNFTPPPYNRELVGYIMRIRPANAIAGNTGNPEVWQASYNTYIRLSL